MSLLFNDILLVELPPTEDVPDTKGERSLQAWKNYIYNVVCMGHGQCLNCHPQVEQDLWVKPTCVAATGEDEVGEAFINNWFKLDTSESGYHTQSEQEIVAEIMPSSHQPHHKDEDDDASVPTMNEVV